MQDFIILLRALLFYLTNSSREGNNNFMLALVDQSCWKGYTLKVDKLSEAHTGYHHLAWAHQG